MLVKDDLGKFFKCRITPYMHVFEYENPLSTFYNAINSINGIGQVYNSDGSLGQKCHIILNLTSSTGFLEHIINFVAFDALCVFTHQSVSITTHPLDTSGLPVLMVVEVIDTGIALQDNRLVTRNTVNIGGSIRYYYESKNNSDLDQWGYPKATIIKADNGSYTPKFNGVEQYYGRVQPTIDSIYAYTGNDSATRLSTYFIDTTHCIRGTVIFRSEDNVTLAADSNYSAGTRVDQLVTTEVYTYNSIYLNETTGGIKNDYGHRNSLLYSYGGSTYLSTAPDISPDNSTISTSNINSSLLSTTYDGFSSTYKNADFNSLSGAGTVSANMLSFKGTATVGADGRVTAFTLSLITPGDPKILESKIYYQIGHMI